MTALTDFLLARIAEDEDAAHATAAERHEHAIEDGYLAVGYPKPARFLAECEAKRRIAAHCASGLANGSFGEATLAEAVARLLALPYADHPDYQPEWSTND